MTAVGLLWTIIPLTLALLASVFITIFARVLVLFIVCHKTPPPFILGELSANRNSKTLIIYPEWCYLLRSLGVLKSKP
jgi:hypothetical protein